MYSLRLKTIQLYNFVISESAEVYIQLHSKIIFLKLYTVLKKKLN